MSDINWEEGFFLKTFPYLFICAWDEKLNDYDKGGDITYIDKKDKIS